MPLSNSLASARIYICATSIRQAVPAGLGMARGRFKLRDQESTEPYIQQALAQDLNKTGN